MKHEYEDMTKEQYEMIAAYRKMEALENAAQILESWADFLPLARPIREEQRKLSDYADAMSSTHGTC